MIGKSLNHYRILAALGSGGMGEVWLAEDTKLHRKVALKILPPEMTANPERRSRFEREARAVAALSHPNIVTIYSVEEAEGMHFITMEAVQGKTLTELIPASGMGLGRFLELALPLADAMSAAHEQGIVHRDLKPDNVIVSNKGVLKVLDFGLAKLREDPGGTDQVTQLPTTSVTAEGKVVGTVAYMSPEQAEGKIVDARSDVFSLGILFYQMTTGEKPFRGDTTLSTLSSILKDAPRSITDINAGLPRDLARIINRCLEKRPPDRFQSAQGLRAELSALRRESESGTLEAVRGPGSRSTMRAILLGAGALVLLAITYALWRSAPPGDDAPREPATAASRLASAASRIAVLPFENLGAPEDGYFAAGVTEEITSRLAAVPALSVISRTSALQYAGSGKTLGQIGQELGVDYILEGTVRWEKTAAGGGRVRVTPTLIKVSEDANLWSNRYDREMESIFDVQSEIASEVVDQLGLTIGVSQQEQIAARPTANMEAYREYLRAKELRPGFFEVEAIYEAEKYLNRSVELDPGFAEAWAELSKTHSRLYHDSLDRTEDRLAKARTAADRALDLAPDAPEARIALGYYYYHGRRDYERALAEFEAASMGRPPGADILAAIGYIKRRQGRWEESTASLEKALELDPLNEEIVQNLWSSYVATREHDRADGLCEKGGRIGWGEDMVDLCLTRQMALRGDYAAADRLISRHPQSQIPFYPVVQWFVDTHFDRWDRALERIEDWPDFALQVQLTPKQLALALTYDWMGRTEDAREAYEVAADVLAGKVESSPQDAFARSQLGLAYAGLGRREEAIREATLAADMVPVSRDALDGPSYLATLASVYLKVGEEDKALDLLDHLLGIRCETTVASVEADRVWQTLRDHPRYREILNKYR